MNHYRSMWLSLLCVWLATSMCNATKADARVPLVVSSQAFLKHRPHMSQGAYFHPENADRIKVCLRMLTDLANQGTIRLNEPSGEHNPTQFERALQVIHSVHDPKYVRKVQVLAHRGAPYVDPYDSDTYLSPESFHQSVLAQSAWIDACEEAVLRRSPAFAVTRPPGHHASGNKSLGFCLFNFAVGAAHHAIHHCGLERVAIFDFDVHFGNGVADLVSSNPKIRYSSIHQHGNIFPLGRGASSERGMHNNILNIPLQGGETYKQYEPLLINQAIPFLKEFDPQLLVVCAGYDALASDELAAINLKPSDYRSIAKHLREAFGDSILFGLEGGYSLNDLPLALKETILPFTEALS